MQLANYNNFHKNDLRNSLLLHYLLLFLVSPLPLHCSMRRRQNTYILIINDIRSKNRNVFWTNKFCAIFDVFWKINCVPSLKHIHDKFINFDMYFYAQNIDFPLNLGMLLLKRFAPVIFVPVPILSYCSSLSWFWVRVWWTGADDARAVVNYNKQPGHGPKKAQTLMSASRTKE